MSHIYCDNILFIFRYAHHLQCVNFFIAYIISFLLQHSYGFIQCCERQARLFFHFSQFSGNIEHLKIGDPVEFEMTYDRRTGKPIASAVTKIAPEVVSYILLKYFNTEYITSRGWGGHSIFQKWNWKKFE